MKNIYLIVPMLYLLNLGCSKSDDVPDAEGDKISKLISADLETMDFPDTQRLEEIGQFVSIENVGDEKITFTDYAISNGFILNELEVAKMISNGLNPRDVAYLEVVFAPSESDNYLGELVLFNDSENKPELKINLKGRGIPNEFTLSSFLLRSQQDVDFLSKFDIVNIDVLRIIDGNNLGPENTPIESLEELTNITTLQELILFRTANITSFDNFANTKITRTLAIIGREEEDLSMFTKLFRENITYHLGTNVNLKDISALSVVNQMNGLILFDNPQITNLNAFEATTIKGSILIRLNKKLEDLCGIKEYAHVVETEIAENGFNPTKEDYDAGNCTLN
ncbi:hypothetical protein J8281_05800 [Aquimarina sp. U1-2]|uniref:hypothetical protein n=1 Tax=Aquimarina sp. U1-2 TaxID=2823141 RepID=UPI001AECA6F0|nr:hypothetical protein [Aquimarina sp. U1-2]MBP2831697.1 hypothetical protein [Aquimarina sp. U1-2]